MCVTLPGRVLDLKGSLALVEKAGASHWYNALLEPDLKVGDSVIVHAGLVLQVLSEEEVHAMETTLAELSMIEQQLTETSRTAGSQAQQGAPPRRLRRGRTIDQAIRP